MVMKTKFVISLLTILLLECRSTISAPDRELEKRSVLGFAETPSRDGRQLEFSDEKNGFCDFGADKDVKLCQWQNLNFTGLKWKESKGDNAYWYGGPPVDVTFDDNLGGYAVYETSKISTKGQLLGTESAMLMSPAQLTTGAKGKCVRFAYAISGLSPKGLRVLLHPIKSSRQFDPPEANLIVSGYDSSEDEVLWETSDSTEGMWKEGQVSYSYNGNHSIIFEGIPTNVNDLSRNYRGYIAIDELTFDTSEACGPFCTFEGGLCGWTQEQEVDDFDWKLSRGSQNPSTGPPRDRSSFSSPQKEVGAFVYIDSGYPRRPGDRTRLMSPKYQPTDPDTPLCMKFWAHMYGNGIGTLRVILIDVNEPDKTKRDNVVWEISGDAGNKWHQCQVPITSTSDFKVVFEGEVGQNNLGDIGLDEISIIQGSCPSAPQVASKGTLDCTFELDLCGWRNLVSNDRLDELDWTRTSAANSKAPSGDHTLGTKDGSFMTLPTQQVQRGGDRGWLMSDQLKGSEETMCLSFWYFMYEALIEPSGPSLGSLAVYLMTEDKNGRFIFKPIWHLKNHQGPNWLYAQAKLVIEATTGSSRVNGFIAIDDVTIFNGDCSTKPTKAMALEADCDFQRGICQFENNATSRDFQWIQASISRRPANIPDHTFGGPIGYIYFDVFNQNFQTQTVRLISPEMELKSPSPEENVDAFCFTFWYTSFGSGEDTKLEVHQGTVDDTLAIWRQKALDDPVYSRQARPKWNFGQVEIDAGFNRVVLVGMSSNGGFAVDDVKIYPGACNTRPESALPKDDVDFGKNQVTDKEKPENS